MASTRTRPASHGRRPRSSVTVRAPADAAFSYSVVLLTRNFHLEITIIGSFSETYMFPSTVDYLDSGKIKTKGIVNKTFKLEQWGEALESIRNKSAIKAAIIFD